MSELEKEKIEEKALKINKRSQKKTSVKKPESTEVIADSLPLKFEQLLSSPPMEEKALSEQEMLDKLGQLPATPFHIPSKEEREYLCEVADEIVKSNFFGESNPFAAKIKVRACMHLNLEPTLFYDEFHIMDFKGKKKLTQSAYLMGYLILRSYPQAIKNQGWSGKGDEFGFHMIVKRPGRDARKFSFTMADAARARLLYKDNDGKWHAANENYFKYLEDMLRSRCYTKTARTEFQDVLGGIIYSPEDFDEHIETGGEAK